MESEEYRGYRIEYADYKKFSYHHFKIVDIKSGYEIATGTERSFKLAQVRARFEVDYLHSIINRK